jgi:CubicO group peptidase (beta-lactamase class C family)
VKPASGLTLAVADRDGIRCAAGFGVADATTGTPVTPSTAFLWFSMSKIVTATAALRLADEGRLDLDSPVTDHVPDARGPWGAPTIRQLLDHTSGLGNPLPLAWVHPADAPAPDPHALLRRQLARRRVWRQPPGRSARYTNLGYLALGQIIEATAGLPFTEYAQQAVLMPTAMRRTGYTLGAGPAAVGYVRGPSLLRPVLRALLPHGIVGDRVAGNLALRPFLVDGPAYGGVVGDVLDAARFVRLHLNDGTLDGQTVLREQTARGMRVIDRPGRPFDHGLGWFTQRATTGRPYVQHLGGGAGFRNVMRLYPHDGVGVVVMANTTTAYPLEPLLDLLAGVS